MAHCACNGVTWPLSGLPDYACAMRPTEVNASFLFVVRPPKQIMTRDLG